MLTQKELEDINKSIKRVYASKSQYPKVSIIVPVYNTERYIATSLNSLVEQTLEDIEIIVVNDGSTDDSQKVISLFTQKDARIKVIQQENKKQGAARNAGMRIAKGEYIGFIDSDDWVDLDYYEKLYNAAKKYNSDLALATNVRTGNGKNKPRINLSKEEFLTDLQKKIDVCKLWKDGSPTNKVYRAEFLKEYNIIYPEGVYCEDKIFTTKALFYSNGLVTVPNLYYYYYRNPSSTVNSTKKKTDGNRSCDKENARREVLEFLLANSFGLRDKDFWAVKKDYKFLGMSLCKIKESLHTVKYLLFSVIPVFEISEEVIYE